MARFGLSLEAAKQLTPGTVLYSMTTLGGDGAPVRWKVNGKPKTWRTRPDEVEIPLKHGLYTYDRINQNHLHLLSLHYEEAAASIRMGRKS